MMTPLAAGLLFGVDQTPTHWELYEWQLQLGRPSAFPIGTVPETFGKGLTGGDLSPAW